MEVLEKYLPALPLLDAYCKQPEQVKIKETVKCLCNLKREAGFWRKWFFSATIVHRKNLQASNSAKREKNVEILIRKVYQKLVLCKKKCWWKFYSIHFPSKGYKTFSLFSYHDFKNFKKSVLVLNSSYQSCKTTICNFYHITYENHYNWK